MKNENKGGSLDITTLPLISEYKLLSFEGLADGSPLTPQFDVDSLRGRYIIIKSFRMIPYVPDPGTIVDLSLSDGADTFKETLAANVRLDRVTDLFNAGTAIRFRINNTLVGIFSTVFTNTTGQYIPDLWEDNIFYKFPEKVNRIELGIFSSIADDLTNPQSAVIPNMRVLVGVYLT